MKILEKSIVPIYEKNCIDGSNFHEQVVNSRELWAALEVKTEYSHWAKRRLEDVDAEENRDYLTVVKKDGRQTLIDYIVTMDTAKEMAMLERNDMGKMVRRYFIEAEKRYRELKIIRARSKAERRLFTDILKRSFPTAPIRTGDTSSSPTWFTSTSPGTTPNSCGKCTISLRISTCGSS